MIWLSVKRDFFTEDQFTGGNVPELAKHYHVTFKTVYKAIKRMRRLNLQKYQYGLFDKE